MPCPIDGCESENTQQPRKTGGVIHVALQNRFIRLRQIYKHSISAPLPTRTVICTVIAGTYSSRPRRARPTRSDHGCHQLTDSLRMDGNSVHMKVLVLIVKWIIDVLVILCGGWRSLRCMLFVGILCVIMLLSCESIRWWSFGLRGQFLVSRQRRGRPVFH